MTILRKELEQSEDRLAKSLLLYLPLEPDLSLHNMHLISCCEGRMKLPIVIDQSWARADLNSAWKAVSQSKLSATEKQLMFNHLWG
jgi:hypothetical protein